MSRKLIARICDVIALVGLANFLVWGLFGAFFLGGFAFLGKEEGGRYFVKDRGSSYTEVSHATFNYSRIHGYTALGGWGIAMLAAFAGYQLRKDKKPDDTKTAT
jgi:hypothetical protein